MSGAPTQTGGGVTRVAGGGNQVQSPGAFQLSPLLAQAHQRFIKMLVYGDPGVGKTTLAGSATSVPSMNDVLLITAEGGDIVFEDNDRVAYPENIDMLKLNRIEQLKKVFEWLQFHVRQRDRGDDAELLKLQQVVGLPTDRVRKYRTVILDSMTDIEAMNMNAVLGLATNQGMGFEVGEDYDVPEFKHFRANNNVIQAVARSFRNLPIHLIIICGCRYNQDEAKRFHYNPALTGQLSKQMQSFVDMVGYMVISSANVEDPTLRRMYIQPSQGGIRFDAKCRRANIKKVFYENPTMEDIMRDFKFPLELPTEVASAA